MALAREFKRLYLAGDRLRAGELLDRLLALTRRPSPDELAALREREVKAEARYDRARRREESRGA